MNAVLVPSRVAAGDILRAGSLGLRVRRVRSILSALGIAIGVASMVAVLGISESSKADLLAQLDRLGTNLLRVAPGQTFLGDAATLPEAAAPMLRRLDGVQQVAATAGIDGVTVRRSPYIDEAETGGISVTAADPGLPAAVGATLRRGRFLDAATGRYPAVVLGADAAATLGIDDVDSRVWLGDRWFTVVGILAPVALADSLDSAALIGFDAAARLFGADRNPSTVYVRADQDRVEAVRDLLGAAANPEHPEETEVSRPSDALEARAAAKTAFTSLFLGLGAVALLVGGVGIANVMVVSVLERRPEIGLRRALGATRRHVGVQFLAESLLLAGAGGLAGTLLGAAVTAAYARREGWTTAMPPAALAGGVGVAIAVGGLAGLYPALRAARSRPPRRCGPREYDPPMSVAGKTAIVTGAATGIGAATARLLAERGARVVAAGLQPEPLRETVTAIEAAGGEAVAVHADVSDPGEIELVAARAQERFGGADILVNNAAVYPLGPWHEADAAQYDAVFATNVRGYFLLAKAVRPQMLARGGGAIVNVASVTFYWGEALLVSYVASKGAVIGFTRALAREAGPEGIRVNAVAPGAFPTAATAIHADQDALWRDVLANQSIKRRGEVEDVARAIAFFAGDDAGFVTGQTLLVDGGWMRG